MLKNWEERPEITATLVNPAFCSIVIRHCVDGYKKESSEDFPFALSPLILPLVLTSRIRERLPNSKSNTIHSWLNENEDLKIGFADNVSGYLPFTKEALMFALAHRIMAIDQEGNINPISRRRTFRSANTEIQSCLKKAELIGKILSKSGNALTIYSILGIKP